MLFKRLAEGEPAAAAAIGGIVHDLVQVVMAIRAMLDPQRIVFGGSVGARPELIERLAAGLAALFDDPPQIEASLIGQSAGLVGAVALAAEGLRNRPGNRPDA
jgi:predicted NBD/HSP70 family sugar kinase